VIVEGGMMASRYSKANSMMREKGATSGFATVIPAPFIYTTPTPTVPSVTTK
jgi:membrane fusion protein (multidrug efflux system)